MISQGPSAQILLLYMNVAVSSSWQLCITNIIKNCFKKGQTNVFHMVDTNYYMEIFKNVF